ncbi:DNRLRE domain-containing protein [Methyloversatilis sp. XJ19-13]|uniref:DNRLRE domain-containing protein n=1 Tax=Methyloversatilis sp. XJ19-13 TaxID=2963430 RepID=UPI00211BE0C8|nr:DNRLRE domain-containing protein [Methyloversatilis sp. XJ19-13]MCQ9376088.1 DNRLRE domain-containing protein [Methyloversatilis sp. XJ19-13]
MSAMSGFEAVPHVRPWCLSLVLIAIAGAAQGVEMQRAPAADATLFGDEPGLANGSGSHLFIGATAAGFSRRALVRFDLSEVPPGSTVRSASLRVVIDRIANGAPADSVASLHRVLASWGEGASGSGGGGNGGGEVAVPGDVTWTQRYHAAAPPRSWSTPGGDFAVESASIPMVSTGAFVWAGTPEMLADIQGWVNDPASNHGWLIHGSEATTRSAKRMVSREGGVNVPLLTLEYDPPVAESGDVPLPAWALGALAASLLGAAVRPRLRKRESETSKP